MKFASFALYSMTKDEHGKDLVCVQATFEGELEICEAHIRHKGRDIFGSQLMKPLDMVLEAAIPDEFPLPELTCYRCDQKHTICDLKYPESPRGFNDEHFKRGRMNRTCFECLSSSGKRWKLSVKNIRCGCCDNFKLAGQLKTVEEVHALNGSTTKHFGQVLIRWVKDLRTLRVCAEKSRQLCKTCFTGYANLRPNGPACGCGAMVKLVTKEVMQKLDTEMRNAQLSPRTLEPVAQPPEESFSDIRQVVCSTCYKFYENLAVRAAATANENKAPKRAAEDATEVGEGAGRAIMRRGLKRRA